MAELTVSKLCKSFPTRAEPLEILKGIDLEVELGERVAVLGPSGCGKSTLLHLIGTLDTPTSGSVTLGGVNPFTLSEAELARFRGEHVGFVFQEHHLLPQLSVLENVVLPMVAIGSASADSLRRAEELIDAVGLGGRRDHKPGELSGGERQRAAVARALLRRPKLVLADEPTGSLDPENAQRIGELLVQLPADHATMLIVVTHSMELAESFPRRLRIEQGVLASANEQ
ncbi:MAG: ABC transporter ATP-binding protein [Pirellulaceae bacterium]|nr:ABC transporter ATP-binding protein [Planctomycetales bacterium]